MAITLQGMATEYNLSVSFAIERCQERRTVYTSQQFARRTATGAACIRHSPKRTTDRAGSNEDGEGIHRSEKAQRTGQGATPGPSERI